MSESFNNNNNNEAENRSYISTRPAIRPWSSLCKVQAYFEARSEIKRTSLP
jgi:hypothetical protein